MSSLFKIKNAKRINLKTINKIKPDIKKFTLSRCLGFGGVRWGIKQFIEKPRSLENLGFCFIEVIADIIPASGLKPDLTKCFNLKRKES